MKAGVTRRVNAGFGAISGFALSADHALEKAHTYLHSLDVDKRESMPPELHARLEDARAEVSIVCALMVVWIDALNKECNEAEAAEAVQDAIVAAEEKEKDE